MWLDVSAAIQNSTGPSLVRIDIGLYSVNIPSSKLVWLAGTENKSNCEALDSAELGCTNAAVVEKICPSFVCVFFFALSVGFYVL